MQLATRMGRGGGKEREFLQYYAPNRNMSHYQPLRIIIN